MKIQYEQKTIKHRWVLTAACGWAWPERVAPTRSPRTEPVKQVLIRFANRALRVLVAADTTPAPTSRVEVGGGQLFGICGIQAWQVAVEGLQIGCSIFSRRCVFWIGKLELCVWYVVTGPPPEIFLPVRIEIEQEQKTTKHLDKIQQITHFNHDRQR